MIISQVKLINNKCRLATYAKHARYLNQHILVSSCFDYQVIILNIIINLIWTYVTWHFHIMTATNKYHPYLRFRRYSNHLHLAREKPDNTTYARSLGPYVRLPFAKSFRGRNCFSTLRMKSWFHIDRPAIAIVLGYLILPPTTIIE
jgi:hypothetical protein